MPSKAKLVTRSESTTSVVADNIPKGSGLTNAELDSNFLNLRDQTIAISDGTNTTDIEAGETITFSGATVAGNTVTVSGGGGGGSVGDFTFSGGNMYKSGDINIYSTTDGSSIMLQSGEDGSDPAAKIILDTRRIWIGQSHTNIDIQANGGLGDLTIANGGTYASTGSYHNYIVLTDSNDGEITISPKTGKWVDVDDVRIDDNTISTNITDGDLKLAVNGTGSIDVVASTSTTIGANGSASALTDNPVGYLKIKINGTEYQIPYYNT
jgi:hypothetical protein